MKLWKFVLACVAVFGLLWLLSPSKSFKTIEAGVVEIGYMGPGGPISGPMEDAVREFETLSDEAHKKDPSKPVYRVISGQNASRDQVADPTRFLVSVAGGMPPDVIFFDRYAVTEWAARGAFEPLDRYIQKDKEQKVKDAVVPESYFASAWDEGVYTDPNTGKKAIYGIPNGIDDRGLFYNKDLLKRAGYDGPPKTWEELEEMAVKLTEKDPETGHIKCMGFIPNWGNSFLYVYGWMNGGEFMSLDGKTCTLNDPKIVQALDWVTNIYDKLGGAKEVYAFQSSFSGNDMDPFLIGKIAMKIDGYWIFNSLAQFGKYLNWAVAPPPVPARELAKGKKFTSWVGGWCYAIPSTAKNKDAAWELIRFLSSPRGIEIQAESDRLTAASQGRVFIPTQNPCLKANEWMTERYVLNNPTTDPKIRDAVIVMNKMLPASRFRPVTAVGQLLWNQQISAMENAIFHKMSSQQALDEGTKLVQRQLDEVLHPKKGALINWTFFAYLYLALVALAAFVVYFWDTRQDLRLKIARKLGFFGIWLANMGGDVETHSRYSRSQWKDGWLTALPWHIGLVAFIGGPIFFSIIFSFSRYDVLNPAQFVGLDNYTWVFYNDPLFWKSLWNTCFMMVGIPLGMGLSLAIALLLNLKIKGVAVWRTFFSCLPSSPWWRRPSCGSGCSIPRAACSTGPWRPSASPGPAGCRTRTRPSGR